MLKKILCLVFAALSMFIASACQSNTVTTTSNCERDGEFAYIGSDGNINIYDICGNATSQLTDDAQSSSKHAYYFFDTASAWSKNNLLASNRISAYAFDVSAHKSTAIGQAVYAVWSPSGGEVLLIEKSNMLDPNKLSVISRDDGSVKWSGEGEAPVWLDHDQVLYFDFVGEGDNNYVIQQPFVTSLSGQIRKLLPKVEKSGSLIRLAWLSSDKKYLATYGLGMEFQANAGIMELEKNESYTIKWLAGGSGGPYGNPAFQWSPTLPILAICTASSGTEGPVDFADGAIQIVDAETSSITAITDSRCYFDSKISWDPAGIYFTYINNVGGISIVKPSGDIIIATQTIKTKLNSSTFKAQAGPWWSPDGSMIGVVAGGKICLAKVASEITSLEFDCVVEGSEMAWRP